LQKGPSKNYTLPGTTQTHARVDLLAMHQCCLGKGRNAVNHVSVHPSKIGFSGSLWNFRLGTNLKFSSLRREDGPGLGRGHRYAENIEMARTEIFSRVAGVYGRQSCVIIHARPCFEHRLESCGLFDRCCTTLSSVSVFIAFHYGVGHLAYARRWKRTKAGGVTFRIGRGHAAQGRLKSASTLML